MSNIVRAWKDETYRQNLSVEEQAMLPANPAGEIELTDTELGALYGAVGFDFPEVNDTVVSAPNTTNGNLFEEGVTAGGGGGGGTGGLGGAGGKGEAGGLGGVTTGGASTSTGGAGGLGGFAISLGGLAVSIGGHGGAGGFGGVGGGANGGNGGSIC